MPRASGLMPACMTIWNDDQSYSKPKMEKYLRWLIDNGAQNLSICGSTGENIAMNMDDQKEVIAHVLSFIAGEVPVYCGTGLYPTLHTVGLSKFAEDHGASGVMVILPYYLTRTRRRCWTTSASCVGTSKFRSWSTTTPGSPAMN